MKKTDQSTSNNSSDTTDDNIAPVDPAKLAVYKGWLKNRKNGNLVALRETKQNMMALTMMMHLK